MGCAVPLYRASAMIMKRGQGGRPTH